MKENNTTYHNPLTHRYCSKNISYIFSPEFRFKTWRKLWVVLAVNQKKLGLQISKKQIEELITEQNNINYDVARKQEKKTRHEVMSHVYAYGLQCPNAKKIIHLGATSAYILDNTDLIQMKSALEIIKKKLVSLIKELKNFALKYKNMATLGFTHFQPAQPTTVGKRASLWLQDLVYDYHELNFVVNSIPFRGAKGTTGTQNSFLKLFEGNADKVKSLDALITKEMGFNKSASVTGQTYSRKIDYRILSLLSAISQTAHKFSNDIRLLQNLSELEEPFEDTQIGSSAMAYKRNPMLSERIASLARYVINITQNAAYNEANQWLERTLDDSANKRLSVPEAFMGTEAIITLFHNIVSGLNVNEKVIEKHLLNELPFMFTENILMECVKLGGDRQELHEIIRQLSIDSAKRIKEHGDENPLLKLLGKHEKIPFSQNDITSIIKKEHYIGLSPTQVEDFINSEVNPILLTEKSIIENNIPQVKV